MRDYTKAIEAIEEVGTQRYSHKLHYYSSRINCEATLFFFAASLPFLLNTQLSLIPSDNLCLVVVHETNTPLVGCRA